MSNLPDFTTQGYKVEKILGVNTHGGRVAYQAVNLDNDQLVVIKQFKFITGQGVWSKYDSLEKECLVLQQLNHPHIPLYLGSFQTDDGFCLVQEYKNAKPLSEIGKLDIGEIQSLATALLEILVYLQEQKPPIIHRDIKPENILYSSDRQVYLIDFGFARMGGNNLGNSSTIKGTMGFMPPEQIKNSQLTLASDLYSLGITLISLLTNTKTNDIGVLFDNNFRIKFNCLPKQLNTEFIYWLKKMVESEVKHRYSNAKEALNRLNSTTIQPIREINLNRYSINLKASEIGENLTYNLALDKKLVEDNYEWQWQVMSHTSDAPHTPYSHSWITIIPNNNLDKIECKITVNTDKLKGNKTYGRKLILESQLAAKKYIIPLKIKTAPLKLNEYAFPYLDWFILLGASFLVSMGVIVGQDFLITLPHKLWLTFQEISSKNHYIAFNNIVIILSAIVGFLIGIGLQVGKKEKPKIEKAVDKLKDTLKTILLGFCLTIFYGCMISILNFLLTLISNLIENDLLSHLSGWEWLAKVSLLSGSLAIDISITFMVLGVLLGIAVQIYIKLTKAGFNFFTALTFMSINGILGYLIALRVLVVCQDVIDG